MKKKVNSSILIKLCIGVCAVIFLFSSFQFFQWYYQTSQQAQEKSQLLNYVDTTQEVLSVDWDALKKINEEIIGWIFIPDTNINYPIVQGQDNNYYLTHSFQKEKSSAGGIFLDADASANFADQHSILYGHNMKAKTMFGDIEKFKNPGFFHEHSTVFLSTPEMNYKTTVIGFMKVEPDSWVYQTQFKDQSEFEEFVFRIQEESLVKQEWDQKGNFHLLTLSTCSYEQDTLGTKERYVLFVALYD